VIGCCIGCATVMIGGSVGLVVVSIVGLMIGCCVGLWDCCDWLLYRLWDYCDWLLYQL